MQNTILKFCSCRGWLASIIKAVDYFEIDVLLTICEKDLSLENPIYNFSQKCSQTAIGKVQKGHVVELLIRQNELQCQ